MKQTLSFAAEKWKPSVRVCVTEFCCAFSMYDHNISRFICIWRVLKALSCQSGWNLRRSYKYKMKIHSFPLTQREEATVFPTCWWCCCLWFYPQFIKLPTFCLPVMTLSAMFDYLLVMLCDLVISVWIFSIYFCVTLWMLSLRRPKRSLSLCFPFIYVFVYLRLVCISCPSGTNKVELHELIQYNKRWLICYPKKLT